MTHPYYIAKARAAFEAVGGDPANALPLAAWAENLHNHWDERRPRLAGVIVAADGTILAETIHLQATNSTPGVTIVADDYLEALGLDDFSRELGHAMSTCHRKLGQPVAHVKLGELTGQAPKDRASTMTAADFAATRLTLGVSADDFAQRMGVNPRTVRSWESGRDRISESAAIGIRQIMAEHTALVDELVDTEPPIVVERGDKWRLAAAARAVQQRPDLWTVWADE